MVSRPPFAVLFGVPRSIPAAPCFVLICVDYFPSCLVVVLLVVVPIAAVSMFQCRCYVAFRGVAFLLHPLPCAAAQRSPFSVVGVQVVPQAPRRLQRDGRVVTTTTNARQLQA